jgi:hypothetical protein
VETSKNKKLCPLFLLVNLSIQQMNDKPSKFKIKNKKHQNHRKNVVSKHFVSTGQMTAKKRTGKFKNKEEEVDEKYQKREISSNLEKYMDTNDEETIYGNLFHF